MQPKIQPEKLMIKKTKRGEPAVGNKHEKTDEEAAPKRLKLQTEALKSMSNQNVAIKLEITPVMEKLRWVTKYMQNT